MATSKERNLKLVITGDITDVSEKLKELRADAKKAGLGIAKTISQVSADGTKATEQLILTSKKLSELKKFKTDSGISSAITNDAERQEQEAIKRNAATKKLRDQEELARKKANAAERLRIAKTLNADVTSNLRDAAAAQKAITINGANSRIGIKARAAAQEKAIFKNLQKELKDIQNIRSKDTKFGADKRAVTAGIEAQRKAQLALNKVYSDTATQLDKLPKRISKLGDEHKSWIRHVTEIVGLYRIVNFGINTAIESIKAIPRIGIEFQTTQAVLESTLGSTAATAGAFKFLDKEANRVGQSVLTIRENFRNLNASMSLAGENTESVVSVFQNLNTITTALHLSSAKTQDVFLAVAQIFNKTKVQSEELVKQLGNLLPGAFAAFARSMEITTLELVKRMQQGTVFATKNVERFLEFMSNKFAAGFAVAEVGLQANIGRMQTSFIKLGEAIFKSIDDPLIEITKSIAAFTNALTDTIKGVNDFSKMLSGLATPAMAAFVGIAAEAVLTSGKIAAGFAAIKTASTVAISGVGLLTVAMNGLKAAMLFLLRPAVIIGGLVAIGLQMRKTAGDTEAAVNKMLEINAAVDRLRNKVKEPLPVLETLLSEAPEIVEYNAILDEGSKAIAKLREEQKRLREGFTIGHSNVVNRTKLAEVEKKIETAVLAQRKVYENLADARAKVSADILTQQQKEKESQETLKKQIQDLTNASKSRGSSVLQDEKAYQQSLQQTSLILQKLQAGEDPAKRQAARNAEIQYQKQIAQAKIRAADAGAKQELEAIANIKIQQSAALRLTEEQQVLTDKLAESKSKLSVQEEVITAKKNAGLITELQAFDQIQAKRIEAINTMREMIFVQEEMARQDPAKGMAESFTKARESVNLLYLQMVKGAERPKETLTIMGTDIRGSLETSLGNAFQSFIVGAKSAGDAMADFATSILDEVARIAAQKLALELIGLAFSAFSAGASSGSSYSSSSLSGSSSSQAFSNYSNSIGSNFSFQKDGGVNTGMSGASGTILNSPTYFPNAKPTMFASGGVVAGEAGKEAVLPLKRNAEGKLGVIAETSTSSGGSNIIIQQLNVHVEQTEDQTSEEQAKAIGESIKAQLKSMVQNEIATSKRDGGQLNPTQLQTTF